MDTKKRHIHRGDLLRNAAVRSGLSITDLSRKAGYSRSSYYNHIEDAELPYEILECYGKIMKHDFTEDLPKMPRYILDDPSNNRPQPKNFEEALQDRDYWRNKYIHVLEQYNNLLSGTRGTDIAK